MEGEMGLIGKLGDELNCKLEHRTNQEHRDILKVFLKFNNDGHGKKAIATVDAVDYVVKNNIPGSFVECGVWAGAHIIAAAMALDARKSSRKIYIYDTFEGQGEPVEEDGEVVKKRWETRKDWMKYDIDSCRNNIFSSMDYPEKNFVFVKGFVQDTIPKVVPDEISILRLDMDMYEPTKHALIHLYPRLSKHGVLIIDDYGKWPGARLATDEYIEKQKLCLF